MEKSVKMSMLLEIYKNMLTDRQADIIDFYYNQNLSLSEIGDEFSISRQAVRKSLVEAEKNLTVLEEKLEILKKQSERNEKIDRILKQIKEENIAKMIEELRG